MASFILLEYQLPLSSRRLDCMVCGYDKNDKPNSVIVELKQWDGCSDAEGDNEVLTWLGGTEREVLHPAVQVGQYKMYLEDTHPAFYEPSNKIKLNACSYLHNYHPKPDDVIYVEPLKRRLWGFQAFPWSIILSSITTYVLVADYVKK